MIVTRGELESSCSSNQDSPLQGGIPKPGFWCLSLQGLPWGRHFLLVWAWKISVCQLHVIACIDGCHLHSGQELSSGLSWQAWQNMCPSGHWNTLKCICWSLEIIAWDFGGAYLAENFCAALSRRMSTVSTFSYRQNLELIWRNCPVGTYNKR